MIGNPASPPSGTQILQFRLDTLDRQLDRTTAGEIDPNVARGIMLRSSLERDCQQREEFILLAERDAGCASAQDALEAQTGTAAFAHRQATGLRSGYDAYPIEAIYQSGEALFARQIGHVTDARDRILDVRRNHGQILGIERN